MAEAEDPEAEPEAPDNPEDAAEITGKQILAAPRALLLHALVSGRSCLVCVMQLGWRRCLTT